VADQEFPPLCKQWIIPAWVLGLNVIESQGLSLLIGRLGGGRNKSGAYGGFHVAGEEQGGVRKKERCFGSVQLAACARDLPFCSKLGAPVPRNGMQAGADDV
jgi:hypothetical protein